MRFKNIVFLGCLLWVTIGNTQPQSDLYIISKKFIDEVKIFEISKGDTITCFYDFEKIKGGVKRKVISFYGTYLFFENRKSKEIEIKKDNKVIGIISRKSISKYDVLLPDGVVYEVTDSIGKGSSQLIYTYERDGSKFASFKFAQKGKLQMIKITQLKPYPESHVEVMDLALKYNAVSKVFQRSNLPVVIILIILGVIVIIG